MVKENSLTLTEISTRVSGLMTKPTVMASIIISMELVTKAIGERISSMATVKKAGLMDQCMKGNTWLVRNME